MIILPIIGIFILSSTFGESNVKDTAKDLYQRENSYFITLSNELIDEMLKWSRSTYLCDYDPLVLPTLTQDDLDVKQTITITDVVINGLSNIVRASDVLIEVNKDARSSIVGGKNGKTSYTLTSILGIRNVTLRFRVKLLKIMSLNIVDLSAFGRIDEINIPLHALVSPSTRHVKFSKIDIKNLESLELHVVQENILNWIPYINSIASRYIKSEIQSNLENRIGEGKEYLNNILSSFATFTSEAHSCPSKPKLPSKVVIAQVTERPEGVKIIPAPKDSGFYLTRGNQLSAKYFNMFEIVGKYKTRLLGTISPPLLKDLGKEQPKFFGFYDSSTSEFVISSSGKEFRHAAEQVHTEDGLLKSEPKWNLVPSQEKNFLNLYAIDDKGWKVKVSPFNPIKT